MASLQGWGRETWGSGAWGEYAPVAATGDGLTSSAAAPAITGDCNITLTGVYWYVYCWYGYWLQDWRSLMPQAIHSLPIQMM